MKLDNNLEMANSYVTNIAIAFSNSAEKGAFFLSIASALKTKESDEIFDKLILNMKKNSSIQGGPLDQAILDLKSLRDLCSSHAQVREFVQKETLKIEEYVQILNRNVTKP